MHVEFGIVPYFCMTFETIVHLYNLCRHITSQAHSFFVDPLSTYLFFKRSKKEASKKTSIYYLWYLFRLTKKKMSKRTYKPTNKQPAKHKSHYVNSPKGDEK